MTIQPCAVAVGRQCICIYLLILSVLSFHPGANAQELEPGAYSRAPVGTNILLFTYSYSRGDVLVDSSLPLRDVNVAFNAGTLAYSRTFGLFGRQANIGFGVPYLDGNARGTVSENVTEVHRSGLGDVRIRFSMNIRGAPALTPKEFATFKRKMVVGASVTVIAPTGQYDPRRLVNLGTNRWAFKPEIGLSKPLGRWTLEAAGGAWLFTSNNDFFGGHRRQQEPLASVQGNVIYTFRPKLFLAGGATYYFGGRTTVDGTVNADRQSNSRYGGTFSYPFGKKHSLKIAASRGLTARFGGRLSTVAVGWQYIWF